MIFCRFKYIWLKCENDDPNSVEKEHEPTSKLEVLIQPVQYWFLITNENHLKKSIRHEHFHRCPVLLRFWATSKKKMFFDWTFSVPFLTRWLMNNDSEIVEPQLGRLVPKPAIRLSVNFSGTAKNCSVWTATLINLIFFSFCWSGSRLFWH